MEKGSQEQYPETDRYFGSSSKGKYSMELGELYPEIISKMIIYFKNSYQHGDLNMIYELKSF